MTFVGSVILSLEQISKSYAHPVLRDITLTLSKGESVALVGANGAGKSTLLKIILGLTQPQHGSGKLFGRPLGDALGLRNVGYLPETASFWPELSAFEFLHAMGSLHEIDRQELKTRIVELLGRLGLSVRGHRPMGTYSKGMLQRVGLAATLLHQPELIILDEPMSGLDPRAQEKLRVTLKELKNQGTSFLISSHSLEDIRALCDRVIVIEKTCLIMDGPTDKILDDLLQRYRSSDPWDEDLVLKEDSK